MKLKNSCSIISSKQDGFEENGLIGDCVFEKISESLEKA